MINALLHDRQIVLLLVINAVLITFLLLRKLWRLVTRR